MDKYTANRYIALKNQIAAGGGSVPQDLIDEVNALDATVNGDDTQDPPIVGLVDIVGDLENSVDELDMTVNGDSTTTPATPGLVDRVDSLENYLDEIHNNVLAGTAVSLASTTSSNPYITTSDGYLTINGTSDHKIYIKGVSTDLQAMSGYGNVNYSLFVRKGVAVYVGGSPTLAQFTPLVSNT